MEGSVDDDERCFFLAGLVELDGWLGRKVVILEIVATLAVGHVALDPEISIGFVRSEDDGAVAALVVDPIAIGKLGDDFVEQVGERESPP
jgi:hypothetical protein